MVGQWRTAKSNHIYDISTTADHGGLQDGLTSTDGLQAMATGWTAGLLLVMFAYYVVYYGLLLQKQRK